MSYTIENETDPAKPALFRVVLQAGANPPKEQREFADSLTATLERLSEGIGPRHPKFTEWVAMLRLLARLELANEALKEGELAAFGVLGARPQGFSPRARLEALGTEIERDLKRFADAPFAVNLKSERDAFGDARERSVLVLQRQQGTAPPTPDQEAFFEELGRAEHFLTMLYEPSLNGVRAPASERAAVWRRLEGVAALALGQAMPTISIARAGLNSIMRDAIRDRGTAVRGAYLDQLAFGYLIAVLGVLLLLAGYHYVINVAVFGGCAELRSLACPEALIVPRDRLIMVGLSVMALAAGAWLTAAQRLDNNSPEVLTVMLSTTNPTLTRAIMVVGFGSVALLLLHTGIVRIAVGGDGEEVFDSTRALADLVPALITGALLGLGEAILPAKINERATAFVNQLGGSGAPR